MTNLPDLARKEALHLLRGTPSRTLSDRSAPRRNRTRARGIFALLCLVYSPGLHAHLNHLQFAAIDKCDGELRIRYRVSKDMVISTLDWAVRKKLLPDDARHWSLVRQLDRILADQWTIFADGEEFHPRITDVHSDDNNNDWVVILSAPLPPECKKLKLRCAAFLEANPRSATLGRINWPGNKTIHHFRKSQETIDLLSDANAIGQAQPTSKSSVWSLIRESVEYKGIRTALIAYGPLLVLTCLLLLVRGMPDFLQVMTGFSAGHVLTFLLAAFGLLDGLAPLWRTAALCSLLAAAVFQWIDCRWFFASGQRRIRFRLFAFSLLLGALQGPVLYAVGYESFIAHRSLSEQNLLEHWAGYLLGLQFGMAAVAITLFFIFHDLAARHRTIHDWLARIGSVATIGFILFSR